MPRTFKIMTNVPNSGIVGTALEQRGYVDQGLDTTTREFTHKRNSRRNILIAEPGGHELGLYRDSFSDEGCFVETPKFIVSADPGLSGGSKTAIARREREMLADLRHARNYLIGRGYSAHLYEGRGPRPSETVFEFRTRTISLYTAPEFFMYGKETG
jgi:hypothetical protein